jgi:catechol 2,3-dioxygenase-like lactoylglutathione lyase family enzyme
VEWRLELVQVPVSDLDRAKSFYRDQVGFTEDFDTRFGDGDEEWVARNEPYVARMVQLTPPGSACSIALVTGLAPGPGLGDMEQGSLNGLLIVVPDINAARAKLIENGVDVSDVMEVTHAGGRSVYRPVIGEPDGWNAYAFFNDPDGNGWVLQQSPGDG